MPLGNSVNAQTTGFQSLNATTGVWNGRTLTPGTGISITNGDGTGGNPTISASGTNPPNSNAVGYDDFISFGRVNASGYMTGALSWYAGGSEQWVPVTADQEAGHPGIISNIALTAVNAVLKIAGDNGSGSVQAFPSVVLTGGAIVLTWIFKIATLSDVTNRYTLELGFTNSGDTHKINFSYADNVNSGKWVINCIDAGGTGTSNTSTTVTAAWHNAQITVNTGATSVNFTMDGVSLGDIATHIPTGEGLAIYLGIFRSSGTIAASSVRIDAMYFNQTLTR